MLVSSILVILQNLLQHWTANKGGSVNNVNHLHSFIPSYLLQNIENFYSQYRVDSMAKAYRYTREQMPFTFNSDTTASSQRHSALQQRTYQSQPSNRPSIEILDTRSQKTICVSENDCRNPIATECYLKFKKIDDFFWKTFNQNSYDGQGAPIKVYINDFCYIGEGSRKTILNCKNAYWNPAMKTFHFGEGDGQFFNPLVYDLDVVCHEYTHAFIDERLNYANQQGALNESGADCLGITFKQDQQSQVATKDADWLIGERTLIGNHPIHGRKMALRSFAEPGTAYLLQDPRTGTEIDRDRQVRTLSQALPSTDQPNKGNDYGGVHINSGIPNHAFYLAAIQIQRSLANTLGKVWYKSLLEAKQDDFFTFAKRTAKNAKQLFGSNIESAVLKGWESVGVIEFRRQTNLPDGQRSRNSSLSSSRQSYRSDDYHGSLANLSIRDPDSDDYGSF